MMKDTFLLQMLILNLIPFNAMLQWGHGSEPHLASLTVCMLAIGWICGKRDTQPTNPETTHPESGEGQCPAAYQD